MIHRRLARQYVFVVIVFLLSTFLFSCTPKERYNLLETSQVVSDMGKIELRFASKWGGVDHNSRVMQRILDDFTASHPGVEIVNESLYGDDYNFKLHTDFASDRGPDIFGVDPDSTMRTLIRSNKLQDLSELMKENPEWSLNFKEDDLLLGTMNQAIYGIPFDEMFYALFVHSEMFWQYDMTVPKDYEELVASIPVFLENGVPLFAIGALDKTNPLFMLIVASYAAQSDFESGYPSYWREGNYIDAMHTMKYLYDAGAFPTNYLSMTDKQADQLYVDKGAVMIAQSSTMMARIDNSTRIIAFPSPITGRNSVLLQSVGSMFSANAMLEGNTEKRKAAEQLLMHVTSAQSALMFVEQAGAFSALKNITPKDINSFLPRREGARFLNEFPVSAQPPVLVWDRSLWESQICDRLPYMLVGDMTPEELWDEVEQTVNDIAATPSEVIP